MRFQIGRFVGQPEFGANVAPVKIDGAGCHAHEFGDLFRGSTLADKIGDVGFHGCQTVAVDDETPAEG